MIRALVTRRRVLVLDTTLQMCLQLSRCSDNIMFDVNLKESKPDHTMENIKPFQENPDSCAQRFQTTIPFTKTCWNPKIFFYLRIFFLLSWDRMRKQILCCLFLFWYLPYCVFSLLLFPFSFIVTKSQSMFNYGSLVFCLQHWNCKDLDCYHHFCLN